MSFATEMLLNDNAVNIRSFLKPYGNDVNEKIDTNLLAKQLQGTIGTNSSVEVENDEEEKEWIEDYKRLMVKFNDILTKKTTNINKIQTKLIKYSPFTRNKFSSLCGELSDIKRRFLELRKFVSFYAKFNQNLWSLKELMAVDEKSVTVYNINDPNDKCKNSVSSKAQSATNLHSFQLSTKNLIPIITDNKKAAEKSVSLSSANNIKIEEQNNREVVENSGRNINKKNSTESLEVNENSMIGDKITKCGGKRPQDSSKGSKVKVLTLNELEALKQSSESKKKLNIIYECPQCCMKFIDVLVLINHIKKSHSSKKVNEKEKPKKEDPQPKRRGVVYTDCAVCSRIMLSSTIDDKVNKKFGKLCCISCNKFFALYTDNPFSEEFQACKGPIPYKCNILKNSCKCCWAKKCLKTFEPDDIRKVKFQKILESRRTYSRTPKAMKSCTPTNVEPVSSESCTTETVVFITQDSSSTSASHFSSSSTEEFVDINPEMDLVCESSNNSFVSIEDSGQ